MCFRSHANYPRILSNLLIPLSLCSVRSVLIMWEQVFPQDDCLSQLNFAPTELPQQLRMNSAGFTLFHLFPGDGKQGWQFRFMICICKSDFIYIFALWRSIQEYSSLHIQVFQNRDKVFIIQVSEVRIFKFKCKKIKLKNQITTTFSFSLNSLFGPLCFRLKYIHNSSMDCHEIWYRYLRPYAFSVPLTIHTIIRWFDLFNTLIYNHKKQLMKSAWCTGTSCKWAN